MSNVVKLPDSYAKHSESNNYKLLQLNEQAIADIKADAQAVADSRDLQNATGRTLDMYGEMVGQKRGTMTDAQYRYMILTKVGVNTGNGTYESVITSLSRLLNCEPSDVILGDGENPCEVVVRQFPLGVLINAGFTSRQAVDLIGTLLPIGVTVNEANFDGTFEFADTADVYDEAAGFGNIEQTIGGFLGLLFGEDEESPVLPF